MALNVLVAVAVNVLVAVSGPEISVGHGHDQDHGDVHDQRPGPWQARGMAQAVHKGSGMINRTIGIMVAAGAVAGLSAYAFGRGPAPSTVVVPAGSFQMGSTSGALDEQPVHRVSGPSFQIDRTEVTNGRYAACVAANACSAPALLSSATRRQYFGDPRFQDYPVIQVSWVQAAQFCAWAGGRLPTEAEWERAARGTADARTYPWGDSTPDCNKANFAGCVGDTDRVGQRPAGQSPYGVQDMAGNVWEWTADWYDANYYARSPESDPTGPDAGTLKVMRGGCWVSGINSLRSTCRKAELPGTWAPNVGFRCVYPTAATR